MEKKQSIGFAITGSFCTHEKILEQIKKLKNKYNIYPILSTNSATMNTRFGTAEKLIQQLTKITNHKPLTTIPEVEPTGPNNLFEILVVAPCTGNTIAKIANGINDTPVTMAVKSHIRNNKPVIIGVSTNDALGINLENIAKLMNTKNFYIIPFYQDDYEKKPKSLASNYELIEETIKKAQQGEQLQPILYYQRLSSSDA